MLSQSQCVLNIKDTMQMQPATKAPARALTEDETMALYEKRYQERRKAEKTAARTGKRAVGVTLGGVPLALQDMLDMPLPSTAAKVHLCDCHHL